MKKWYIIIARNCRKGNRGLRRRQQNNHQQDAKRSFSRYHVTNHRAYRIILIPLVEAVKI